LARSQYGGRRRRVAQAPPYILGDGGKLGEMGFMYGWTNTVDSDTLLSV